LSAACLITAAGCSATRLPPASESSAHYAEAQDERDLILQADEYEKELDRKGFFLRDPELQAYIDQVGAKLLPAGIPPSMRFRFHVVRDPTMNAFAMCQGAVQVHVGLLARLDNEAQLAHVMAHEITHAVHRHQLRFLHSLQNKTVAAKVASIALVPSALVLGPLASLTDLALGLSYAAAVTGYGRDLEQEADLEALRLVARAGYPVEESPRLFARLNEIAGPGALENFFYGSHPLNAQREAYTRDIVERGLVASAPGSSTHSAVYKQKTSRVVIENIRLRLQARHYEYARQEAQAAIDQRGETAELRYFLGDAHLYMARDPDGAAREAAFRKRESPGADLFKAFEERAPQELMQAEAEFRRALALDSRFALAHRGLGYAAYERGDREAARRELQRFLASDPPPGERRSAERLLEEVRP
jgi:predicted Zn-dependent protease